MKTIQELANDYLNQFEIAIRIESKNKFWRRKGKDNIEDDLYTLIYDAHNEMGPDDYTYNFIVESLDMISDSSDDELEDLYLEADIYNYELFNWLASHSHRISYCDDAQEEYRQENGIIGIISAGQQFEKNEVLASVRNSLEVILEKINAEDSE